MNGGEATLNELRADIESMSVEGQEHALFLLTNHPAAGVRQIGGVIAGAVGRTGLDSRAKSMQAAPSKASAYDDLPPPTVLAAGRAVAANQIQEVDSARFRAYVVRRLTETEYDPSADRGRSLLVPVEVIIDLLVSSLPPGALDVVLGNITSDAARGDRTARYEKQLLDHWAACKMTGRITSLGETVPQRDIDDLLIASKELIPALIGLTAVMAPQRTSIAIDAVKEQAEELNSLATMVQGLMEISFQAMKRDMQRASSSGSGPLGGQSGTPKQPTAQNKSGGCYVATAVYGSYDCPEVWVLRRWRDNHLATTVSGRQFIRLYYRFSPTVVRAFGNERWFSRAVRRPLDRFVDRLRATGYSSLPYSDDESSSRGGPYEVRTPFATRVVAGGR
jgi:hypothetical protein